MGEETNESLYTESIVKLQRLLSRAINLTCNNLLLTFVPTGENIHQLSPVTGARSNLDTTQTGTN